MIVIGRDIAIPFSEFEFSFARSSGPGGQNVNKTNSKAVLTWNIEQSLSLPDAVKRRFLANFGSRVNKDGLVVIASDTFRDQNRNISECIEKLKAMLQQVHKPPKVRTPTKPTRASKERRLTAKRIQAEKKENRRWKG